MGVLRVNIPHDTHGDLLVVGDYLTDEKRLVQVLAIDDDGCVHAEDVRLPCDRPTPVMRLRDLSGWRHVAATSTEKP